jgi:demethylmenaquinone methyltransferase/2-methoxy-6-polyprenyl-1,4-benzoquinol methylase
MKQTSAVLFAGLARSYEKSLDYATLYQDRRWKNWASKMLKAGAGDVVLDVGCGTLVFEERMSGQGCSFVGLDLSSEMLGIGRRKGVSNVVLLTNGDAESLPFPDKTFDSVVSCYVPKYVDLAKFAGELARVAKPGANVVVYDFTKPRGLLAPFLQLYIQCGLRAVGFLLDLVRKPEAFTFNNLPWIVEETIWDRSIVQEMEGKGFESLATSRLTGGIVLAYCGRRKNSA